MDKVDFRRRRLLLGGTGALALPLASCCSTSVQTLQESCSPRSLPFLSNPDNAIAGSKTVPIFDAHTHFFNAADVPVAGFLAKSIGHSASPALRPLIAALAPIVEIFSKSFAPTPAHEMEELCRGTGAGALSLLAATADLDTAIRERRRYLAEELFRELQRRSDVPRIMENILDRVQKNRIAPLNLGSEKFDAEFIRNAFEGGAYDSSSKSSGSAALAPQSLEEVDAVKAKGVFGFVGLMLSPRHHNLRSFIRDFSAGSPGVSLAGCFGAMVDFNYWLDCPAKASNMRDQVLLHERMSVLSGGFLMPVVAYNPWVDIKEHDASLKTVTWAIEDHGCVGVKIYPPMGFYPYGNRDNGPLPNSQEMRPDLGLLDAKLEALYAECERLGVPVMAHANESMGRDDDHDLIAGVEGWQLADRNLKALKHLRVNVGHFGGYSNHGNANWTAEFASLMGSAKRLEVYGDLGHWEGLFNNKEAIDRLRGVLSMPLTGGGTVADRVMYGSDWLMLSKERDWERYADQMLRVLEEIDPSRAIIGKVMSTNVLKCYGLSAADKGPNRQRWTSFLARRGVDLPRWLRDSTF